MLLSEAKLYEELKKQYFINIPFQIDHAIINDAIESFFRFLKEPEEIKTHIDFTIAPNHRRGDVGYKHRDSDADIYNDSKDFFHFHPALFEKYPEFLKQNPVIDDFVQKAKPIWDLTYKTLKEILTIFEKDFPGTIDKVFDTSNPHILLRFLKYNWQESGKNLAKPHFDAGSFTLAITESGPGLRIGSCPEDLKLVQHKEGHAIFMLSSNYKQVIDTNDLSPGWHDVIQLDETLIGKPYARWAIVAFIEAAGVKALPRTETHKWHLENI